MSKFCWAIPFMEGLYIALQIIYLYCSKLVYLISHWHSMRFSRCCFQTAYLLSILRSFVLLLPINYMLTKPFVTINILFLKRRKKSSNGLNISFSTLRTSPSSKHTESKINLTRFGGNIGRAHQIIQGDQFLGG